MRNLVDSLEDSEELDKKDRDQLSEVFQRLRLGSRSRPSEQESFFPMERCIARLKRDAGRLLIEDALQRGDFTRGAAIAAELVEDDPLDRLAQALNMRVQDSRSLQTERISRRR
jgi:hypothetical protein